MRNLQLAFVPKTSSASRGDGRVAKILLILLVLNLIVLWVSLLVGDYPVPILDVIKAVLGLKTQDPESPFVVITLRLPRVLIAWLVGMALALAGAIMQGLTRNPLADPSITGVSAGAALAVVTTIILFPATPANLIQLAALSGGLGIALLIYLLSGTGERSPLRLILVGIVLGVLAGAFTTLMLTFGNVNDVNRAMVWLVGSVSGKTWKDFWPLLPWLVVFAFFALRYARELDTLQLGHQVAVGLGSRVELQRSLLLLFSVGLTGASVATVGTIGFVGLIAPHIARQMVGTMHENLLPVAAMMGGIILAGSDVLARTLFAPSEFPCGLLTAGLGGPYFFYLLYRSRKG